MFILVTELLGGSEILIRKDNIVEVTVDDQNDTIITTETCKHRVRESVVDLYEELK